MAKRINYSELYTLRADGRYMGFWHELDADGNPTGPRHAVYDRDPEHLHHKIQEKETPAPQRKELFRDSAARWEGEYRETVGVRTWANFRPHYEDMVARWGAVPTEEITAELIHADLQRAKAQGLSRTVVNSRKVIVSGILNGALARGVIPFNPALSVRLPKGLPHGRRSAPDDDVLTAICENIDEPFGLFVFLLLCTGLRKSEALALHREDVDLKAGLIHVRRSLTYVDNACPTEKLPKNGKTRTVPIVKVLAAPLKRHLDALSGPLLFPQPASNRSRRNVGGYMSERAYEGAWDRYCTAVGFVDANGKHTLTAHCLRHATATLLFESGVDVYTAQRILGHANVSTTMEIYAELREKQQAKSVKKYNRLLSNLLSNSKSA